MEEFSLSSRCTVNTNKENDIFVGIKYDEGKINISFPLGYHLENSDDGIRKDIFLLIKTISRNSEQKRSELQSEGRSYTDDDKFPMQAYLYIIQDFIEHGYYVETERQQIKSRRGKIDWPRTIKTQKAYVENDNAYYIDFIINKNMADEDKLITRIHEFCVYESFEKMGWLFTDHMPQRPRIRFQEKLFLTVLRNSLNSSFNDRNRRLFQNMIAIVEWRSDPRTASRFTYGTYTFEHIWEKMVDRLYGIKGKDKYFPQTAWHIVGRQKQYNNASLIPDTIMLWNDKIFVLDSKYYKYGDTTNPGDLPESTSINKQITYAEYIAESEKFLINGEKPVVYNAFILPYDSNSGKFGAKENIKYIGYATGDWKTGGQTYENVLAILLDVKYLMQRSVERDADEIRALADLMEEANQMIIAYSSIK